MIVGRHMINKEDLTTVNLETGIDEVLKILNSKDYLSLPVMEGEELVGILYKSDLFSELVSTELSKADFLNQKVDKYTVKDLDSVETTDLLEVASSMLIDAKQSFLPVYERDEYVGIITPTAIFKANSELLGIGKGTRISLRFVDGAGRLASISNTVNKLGGNIITLVIDNIGLLNLSRIIMRVENCDIDELTKRLSSNGFSVERVD